MIQMPPLSSTNSNVGNFPIRSSSSGIGRVAPLASLGESCLSDRQKKILGIAIVIVGVVAALFCPLFVMTFGAIGFAALGGIGIALAGMWIWIKSSHTSTPSNELSRNEPSQPPHIARTQTVAAAHLEAAATLSARSSSLAESQMPAAIEEESDDDFFSHLVTVVDNYVELSHDFFRRLLIAFAEPLKDLTANQKTYWLQEMSKHENLFKKWELFRELTSFRDDDKNYPPLNRAIFCLLDHMHNNPESIKDYLPCLPFFMSILRCYTDHPDHRDYLKIPINRNVFIEDKHLLALNTVSQALIIHYPKAPLVAVARGCLFPHTGYDKGLQGFISIYHQMRPEAKRLNSEILARLIAKPGPAMPRDLASIVTSYLSLLPYDFIRLVMAQMYCFMFLNIQEQQWEYLAQLIHSGNNDPEFIKAILDPFAQQSLQRTNILLTLCSTSDSLGLSVSCFKILIPFIKNVVMAGYERERDGLKKKGFLNSVIYPLLNEEMSQKCQAFLKLECKEFLEREGVQGGNFLRDTKGKFFKFIQSLLVKQIPAGTASLLNTHIQHFMDVRFYRGESVLLDYYHLMFLRFKINAHTESQIPNLNPTPAPNITPAISLVED